MWVWRRAVVSHPIAQSDHGFGSQGKAGQTMLRRPAMRCDIEGIFIVAFLHPDCVISCPLLVLHVRAGLWRRRVTHISRYRRGRWSGWLWRVFRRFGREYEKAYRVLDRLDRASDVDWTVVARSMGRSEVEGRALAVLGRDGVKSLGHGHRAPPPTLADISIKSPSSSDTDRPTGRHRPRRVRAVLRCTALALFHLQKCRQDLPPAKRPGPPSQIAAASSHLGGHRSPHTAHLASITHSDGDCRIAGTHATSGLFTKGLKHMKMAAVGDSTSGLAPPVDITPIDTDTPKPFRIDEDESSLSSTGSDLFDHNKPPSKSQNGAWEVNANGEWRRYGSLESATSTAISSMCSSTAADDSQKEQNIVLSPSRKRMSDGTVKQTTIRLNSKASNAAATPQSVANTPEHASQSAQPKRRGRPPKDKSALPTYIPRVRRASMISKLQDVVKPRSSIPYTLPNTVFASQCIEAARASRLDPYALHVGENSILMDMITSAEVTVYLNIRNAILRLWVRNPRCSITVEEAAGCAKEARFFGLAEVAYKWLSRSGYINFGCVDVPHDPSIASHAKKLGKQKTVAVIGAGVSGLTTARQLEGLFAQYAEHWLEKGERPPRVLVLEGRKRIGGRVYSKPLRSQLKDSLPNDLRNTAEMGAMIVTGFDHGNPLDTIIRGQLGLHYHLMTDALTIYDTNGKAVKERRDMLNTDLYTDITDRAGDFRAVAHRPQTLKGDEELISRCRDPLPKGFDAFQLEPLPSLIEAKRKAVMKRGRRRNAPPGTEKLTGRHQVVENSSGTVRAAKAAHEMGWKVRDGVSKNHTLSLRSAAEASKYPTLGAVMDEAISQYQGLLEMTAQDMRLLNWHHANLEYANAAPVPWLSLSGHDQDTGNEFEGAHSEVVGGYTQVPRGLMNLPTKLDVRFDRVVDSIHYDDGEGDEDGGLVTKIVCTNGEVIEADEVVLTTPLGVLKSDAIDFDPPLPNWKQGAIDRMGFGLLNKV